MPSSVLDELSGCSQQDAPARARRDSKGRPSWSRHQGRAQIPAAAALSIATISGSRRFFTPTAIHDSVSPNSVRLQQLACDFGGPARMRRGYSRGGCACRSQRLVFVVAGPGSGTLATLQGRPGETTPKRLSSNIPSMRSTEKLTTFSTRKLAFTIEMSDVTVTKYSPRFNSWAGISQRLTYRRALGPDPAWIPRRCPPS